MGIFNEIRFGAKVVGTSPDGIGNIHNTVHVVAVGEVVLVLMDP